MIAKSPIEITSRLLFGVRIGQTEISITYATLSGDNGRERYRYYIDGEVSYTSDDLQSGCGGGNLQEGLTSLLGFLGACADAYAYNMRIGASSENIDLFPPDVAAWAYSNSDEISMLAMELEEGEYIRE